MHAVTEALKLAAADREVYFGDPDFVDVPLDVLLSKEYAAPPRALNSIRPRRGPACRRPARSAACRSRPGAPIRPPVRRWRLPIPNRRHRFCVSPIERGNVFAATPSDPTIGGAVVPGTGIVPSMWGSRGYTGADHPARVGPGRRPRMSANPAIAIKPGEMVMPFGSPGSEVLGQAMVQVFLNQVVFGMDPQSACEAPRFASYSWPESALPHSYRPGHLCIEEDVGTATGEALAAMGHRIEWWPERKYLAGSVCTIQSDLRSGVKWAGADPRRTAYAVGW